MQDETWTTLRSFSRINRAEMGDALRQAVAHGIQLARNQGASWAEIGRALRCDPRTVKRWAAVGLANAIEVKEN